MLVSGMIGIGTQQLSSTKKWHPLHYISTYGPLLAPLWDGIRLIPENISHAYQTESSSGVLGCDAV